VGAENTLARLTRGCSSRAEDKGAAEPGSQGCRNAIARLNVTCAAEPPVIIAMTPPGLFVALGLFSLPSEKFFARHQLFGSIWRVVSLPRRPENVQIYSLRQRAHRAEYGGKAL
jgi:hypothetical protein